MPYFRVMLEGNGILVKFAGERDIVGFFTTRVVRADSVELAIREAKSMVMLDWTVGASAALNKGSPPELSVDNVWSENWYRALFFKNKGHVFYPADDGT